MLDKVFNGKSDRLFDDDVTIEEVEELYEKGYTIAINNGRVTNVYFDVVEAGRETDA